MPEPGVCANVIEAWGVTLLAAKLPILIQTVNDSAGCRNSLLGAHQSLTSTLRTRLPRIRGYNLAPAILHDGYDSVALHVFATDGCDRLNLGQDRRDVEGGQLPNTLETLLALLTLLSQVN